MPDDEARDLLITAAETNHHHGVGILLQRFFGDSSPFVCLRTTSLYGGDEPFGSAHHELCSKHLTLPETEDHLKRILQLYRVRRILCVPYYREEFVHAVMAKRLTSAPLCTYLMDDQNIYAPHVPDHWVGDLLNASDLCLGISPEMCAAYRRKFGQAVHLLPPLIEKETPLIPCYWSPEPDEPLRAAMIGNVWTARRFDQLRGLLRLSGLHLDWYGNGPKATWLLGTPEEWEADNIRCMGFLSEEDLVAVLASYPFVLIPSGSLDADDDNPAFSRLSLPSRLLFLHASTDTPVMILGSEETAAGRFVTRLQTGLCSRYDRQDLQGQIGRLLDPRLNRALRDNIRRWSGSFVLPEAGEWLWRSLQAGRPEPAAFHAAFPPDNQGEASWLDAIKPARPRPLRPTPKQSDAFRDEHAVSFGYLRTSHLPILAAAGLNLPAVEELELSLFQSAVAHYVLQGALPKGGDVLFLGADIPANLQNLPPHFKLWRIASLEEWQNTGYAGDPRHVTGATASTAYPSTFPQFDAIISICWCGQLPADHHVLEGLSLYLEACTRPGGVNLHFFTAVLHPAFFWTGPAHDYLRKRFLAKAGWPDLDELLGDDDLFTMSRMAYDRYWKPSVGKPFEAFGKPLTLGLYWRIPGNS
jgi:hypothetical protein